MSRPGARWGAAVLLVALGFAPAPRAAEPVRTAAESPFEEALRRAGSFLQQGKPGPAAPWIVRALERDPRSQDAWVLRARAAALRGDLDDEVYSLHVRYRLAQSQGAARSALKELGKELQSRDPMAGELLSLRDVYLQKLLPLAEEYEKDRRPHSAIRVHQEILALDPEYEPSRVAIERISSLPDPSLADTARPKDLLEGISEEWIREFDDEHSTWDTRARMEREHYVTFTDAGYEVLVRAAEAMENINGFYREFFQYGTEEDGRSVPRITLHIFKDRDEYLTLGIGPPAPWSGGHFTGSHVETYIGPGGFQGSVGTLFHEAAHQFVSLATSASGWLNEGLASYFEGTRILANGTVLMNMPANHRLMPLATRMERGWMEDEWDGMDRDDPTASTPDKAPTFRILLENRYPWGPPWYAPTWGFVFFLYNFQDDADGRYLYRDSFRTFINRSGGRQGDGAVENFVEVVLRNPAPPTKGVEGTLTSQDLPQTAEELDETWKDWTLALRDEVSGRREIERPYLTWGRHAIDRKEYEVAKEHFEKGVVEQPEHVELLMEFATLLAGRYRNTDRASRLALQALQVLEAQEEVDADAVRLAERRLADWDPKRRTLDRIHEQLLATASGLAQRYLDAQLPLLAMDVSWRLGNDLGMPSLFQYYEQGLHMAGGRSLALWELAYNEQDLRGWTSAGNESWTASGVEMHSRFGEKKEGAYQFQFLLYDKVTSGDFSLEAEVFADPSLNTFCGLMFGQKGDQTFHSVVLHPGEVGDPRYGKEARQTFLDLTSFFGGGQFQIHRHNPLGNAKATWHKLRVDVLGPTVDVWFDDEFIVSQTFANLSVLRGGFGLMTGPGEARWRNVRYLSRSPRDLAGRLERDLVMGRLETEAAAEGRTVGNSFVGQVPPFPQVKRWLQEPLSGWEDLGPVPTVLLFWSIGQNERLPLHEWLRDLATRHEEYGLRVVSVAAPDDDKALPDYLAGHAFPGSVAVDVRRGTGYGESFEDYLIPRFGMPRLLLLDLDHTVVWEGDPGFAFGTAWKTGEPSYLDQPLDDLILRRNLKELIGWRKEWEQGGAATLARGDLAAVLPLLERLGAMRGVEADPEIGALQRKLSILKSSLRSLEATAASLQREEAEAALPILQEWAARFDVEVPREVARDLRPYLQSEGSKAWKQCLAQCERTLRSLRPDREERSLAAAQELADLLAAESGRFPALLREGLAQALESQDLAAVQVALEGAPMVPARWLVRDFFGW